MRISCTVLESFRLFMDPEQEWMSEGQLVASINGTFVPTPAVKLGSAFGSILEQPDRYQVLNLLGEAVGYQCGDYTFSAETMDPCLALIDRRGVFEAKGVKAYGDVDVVAKADHLYGAHLKEFKTTQSTFDYDKYQESCQWRFMLDIFEAVQATYHVFILDDHENGVADVKRVETFNLFPYADLHQDCHELVEQFTDYVRVKGLDDGVRERQREAAAR